MPHREEFVDLFSKHARRVQGYIHALLPNWADAEDVFQETSRVIWEKFDDFEPGTNFFAWACRIAQFQVLAFRQREVTRRRRFSEAFLEAVMQQAERDAELLDAQHQALADCIEKLTARDRQLVHLRFQADASVKTVATATGRSADAIYKALNRIQAALFRCVERSMR